jgi:hypothetical protein
MIDVIACLRTTYTGIKTESRIGKCDQCGHSIWIALTTPIVETAEYRCIDCIDWNSVDEIAAPSAEQMRELMRVLKAARQ